jgi:hypothetical protein
MMTVISGFAAGAILNSRAYCKVHTGMQGLSKKSMSSKVRNGTTTSGFNQVVDQLSH